MDQADRDKIMSPAHSDELLARAEEEAHHVMAGRYETAKWIAEQASVTLTVLLAGVGGSLAYAVKVLDATPTVLEKSAAVLCVYLVILALGLVWFCMRLASYPSQRNEPRCWLYDPGQPLHELRRRELLNLQERLDDCRSLNERRALALNCVRVATALSPGVFVAAVAYLTP